MLTTYYLGRTRFLGARGPRRPLRFACAGRVCATEMGGQSLVSPSGLCNFGHIRLGGPLCPGRRRSPVGTGNSLDSPSGRVPLRDWPPFHPRNDEAHHPVGGCASVRPAWLDIARGGGRNNFIAGHVDARLGLGCSAPAGRATGISSSPPAVAAHPTLVRIRRLHRCL